MSNNFKPLGLAVGVAFVGSLALAQAAGASAFSVTDLPSGYQVGEKGKEGSCGEGKCGEGKCGVDTLDTDKNGSVSATEFAASGKDAAHFAKLDADADGAVTQTEWDSAKAAMEGKCGEGKCGEGKCGGEKK
ncbi:hypothetical protein [Chiayiivirga flava]|uniref:Putative low-complexity protein n=1 Tax=Chiayiivirga flava TaxID=659595 RepID=A0A7W8D5G2_9GAMM|nr:hypothetical protein [Chiayiivirga flava]MBB5207061.1 putative low-complexity protein [Chiayiivirga flava]